MHFENSGRLAYARQIAGLRSARWTSISAAVIAGGMSVGCGPGAREPLADGGAHGDATPALDGGGCAQGTEYVYTIDLFPAVLSQFDPTTKTFHALGTLSCPTSAVDATPFSMSVDRDARAWVLYSSGELFRVQLPGLECTKTSWSSPNDLKIFGMGFSTDQAGGSTESLFIVGGLIPTQTRYEMAKVNLATLSPTMIATTAAIPEMTGTGSAELWGFFPDPTNPRIERFDKTTGASAKSYSEPTLAAGFGSSYAFAQWGGDYWVFLDKGQPSPNSSTVYQVDGMTGAIKSTTEAPGHEVVGAGVSTCAPTVLL